MRRGNKPQFIHNENILLGINYHEIRQEVENTGIEKLLKEANKRYFALSPRRQPDGSLRFWLNPMEQQRNNFGWFILKDLQDWAENKGPIPIRK